ncbi:MAG: peptidoglycan editing factor PgeF [Rickettsiales bacterium]|nr:peptidoglycan editing factor PgeF [Rickettsiales bacterium]
MTIKYHFFGTEVKINRDLENREPLNKSLTQKGFQTKHTLLLNQIHSNNVCVIDTENKIYGDQNLPKADAIVTNQPNINIGVITADCAPILLYCKQSNIIAATHAGWKGAKAGIIKNTISKMKELGAAEIQAIIGPMIQQDSYEVSKEFYDDFLSENLENKEFFISGKLVDKFQFDLNGYVENKLRKSGIENIQNSKIDTYSGFDKYFSYRRANHQNKKDCGRNISIINVV